MLVTVLALTACLTAPAFAAAPITVTATVDSNQVTVGVPFALTITIDGEQNAPVPSLDGLDGFRADYLGPSTQVSFINGRMSASVSHRFRMIAERAGQFSVGPVRVAYDGRAYESNVVPLTVAAAAAAPAAQGGRGQVVAPGGVQALRLAIEPAIRDPYVGQRVDVTLTLYVGNIRVREMNYPVFNTDGATFEKFGQPEESNEVIDGRRYHTVRLRTTMTPLRPGPIDLDATMTVAASVDRRSGNQFFDSVFGGDVKPVDVPADAVPMTVRPLPEAGRPADFAGAVGSFEFTMNAQPTELDIGDPITLRLELSGSGNLSDLTPPSVSVDDRFRRYDAQPVKGEDGAGRRVFEQVVIPKVAAVRELPAVRFSFFDPAAGAYRTITRGPVPLTVRAVATGRAEVLDSQSPTAPAAGPAPALGRDIVYIKDAPGTFQPRGDRLYQRGWFLALQVVPVALFAALAIYVRRRDRLAADPRRLRFRLAGREVRRALAELQSQAAAEPRFYDALAAAIGAYLSAKLDLPPGAVERERVLARLGADICPPAVHESVTALFALVERARYAPAGDADRSQALTLARQIVDGLERARGLERRAAAGLLLAVACAAALSSARAEEAAPQTAFFQGNQAYADGRYGDAIAAYESVRAAGQDSGGLEFNLGNALFKDGQLPRAIASYERAHRLLPRDPDVESNLAYARELAKQPDEAAPIWQRIAFPFAFSATGSELAVLASLTWWGFWLLLAARLLAPGLRPGLNRAAAISAGLYLLLAASLGLRLAQVELRDAVIVTSAADASVRFEPSITGTEHFPAAPGTELDVAEARDGWLQVRRADGRRGWIAADAVEPLQ
ncbi:MAG: BatD family protein [Candidatus Binatia bacterium]